MLTAPITAAPDVPTFFRDPAPASAEDTANASAVLFDVPADAPEAQEARDAFIPDTADKVDWVLGKIADARARAARIRENAELLAKAADRDADTLEWKFGAALQTFARQELEGGKKKSVRLFHGVIGFRTKPAGVDVTDTNAALEWARQNCTESVRESLDKKALADTLLSTGEALPFARLTPAEDVFYIR